MGQAKLLRQLRRSQRALNHRVHGDLACIFGLRGARVFVHHASEQLLVQRSPVHANSYRLIVPDRHFNHGAKIIVVLTAHADVAGIDAVLGQRLCTLRIFRQQQVAVVMEVADDRHADVLLLQAFHNGRNGLCGRVIVHRHAHQLRACAGQLRYLRHRCRNVRRISICHGLDHDRHFTTYAHIADLCCNCLPALNLSHSL